MDSVSVNDLFDLRGRPVGGFDEMFDADGQVRPHWHPLQAEINQLGPLELHRRIQQAEEQIHNHGVTFNPYDLSEGASRPWSFDAIPLLIDWEQWQSLSAGLEQRCQVMELILQDLLGEQSLLRERLVPPSFLFEHPGFQPAYRGLCRGKDSYLQLYAADLARDQQGQWWVVGDRTRAPFGLGYALENRLIAANLLPQAFGQCMIQRLAGFFQAFHQSLLAKAPAGVANPHVVVWTKGPHSRSFFEDAYLARYLGYTLVQSDDLAVRGHQLLLKTLGGLVPVHVVLRRVNDDHCDPVELSAEHSGGVAGLLEVIRAGQVYVSNALGSRLVESPLLNVWLPRLAEHFGFSELKIPTVPTWWCGDPESLDWMTRHWDDLLIRPAYRMNNAPPIYPGELAPRDQQSLLMRLQASPHQWVAQKIIHRSTAPVWYADQVQRWPLALRGFVLNGVNGYQTLPGGLARVAYRPQSLDQSPTSGEKSQDVWVQGHRPSPTMTLMPSTTGPIQLKRSGAELPSRVADSFYWLGRNLERAEFGVRLMRAALGLLQNEREGALDQSRLLRAMAESGQIEPDLIIPGIRETLPALTQSLPASLFDDHLPLGFRSSLDHVVRLGAALRDRLSLDAWQVIHRMDSLCSKRPSSHLPDVTDTLELLDRLTLLSAAFSGLVAENTTRTLGWRFCDLGRRVERAHQTCTFLLVMFVDAAGPPAPLIEAALQVLDSLMTYRLRYLATIHPTAACDLLLHDQSNPRSVAYQLDLIEWHVGQLPSDPNLIEIRTDQRLAVTMKHSVRMSDPAELMTMETEGERVGLKNLLGKLVEQLTELSRSVSSRYLVHAPLQRHLALSEETRIASEEPQATAAMGGPGPSQRRVTQKDPHPPTSWE